MSLKLGQTRLKAEHAYCDNCVRLHPQATRERVRQHVKMTGHTARFAIGDVTVYRLEESP